jgi:hypothetical protein
MSHQKDSHMIQLEMYEFTFILCAASGFQADSIFVNLLMEMTLVGLLSLILCVLDMPGIRDYTTDDGERGQWAQ